MQDSIFLAEFEHCTLPKEYFKHQGHLRITWIYLTRYSLDQAIPLIKQGILRYATSLGAAHIYHETLTCAWIYLVKAAMQSEDCFATFMKNNPQLLDKNLPFQYYSQALLNSDHARKTWVEPDLQILQLS